MKHLCLAGGVALNCVANGRLLREGPFEQIWIQPAAGDAGGAIGSALFAWHQLLEHERLVDGSDLQKGSLLGPRHETGAIRDVLDARQASYHIVPEESALLDRVAGLLADGKVIGWFHGRMEFGPRALGCRSIIRDPRNERMQAILNAKIKRRESFRPFAPCVLKEKAHEIFELRERDDSPYMLLVAPLRAAFRRQLTDDQQTAMKDPDACKRINVARSDYPAVTHVDFSARVQTVDQARHGRFYRLMKEFERSTGCPMVVNTSFNIRGEPIVNTPEQALDCFLYTEMDALVLEDCLLLKDEQPPALRGAEAKSYFSRFAPD